MDYQSFLENHVTWYHHASLRLDFPTARVYVDPYQLSPGEPQADLILITHWHYDHFDPPSLSPLLGAATALVTPAGKIDFPVPQHRTLKPGESYQHGEVSIHALPAYNTKASFHPREKQWLGYLIAAAGLTVYVAGDTSLIPEMRDLRPDLAFLPVGGTYTMDPEEAAEAVRVLSPRIAIPVHYGTVVGPAAAGETFARLVAARAPQVKVEVLRPQKPHGT